MLSMIYSTLHNFSNSQKIHDFSTSKMAQPSHGPLPDLKNMQFKPFECTLNDGRLLSCSESQSGDFIGSYIFDILCFHLV